MKQSHVIVIFAACVSFSMIYSSTPVDAVVEIAPGVVAKADQEDIHDIVAAFNRAEEAVEHADLDTLMNFYGRTYNYHGLKRSDVRRVWGEVFVHYEQVTSKHLFTELKLFKADGVRKAHVTCTGGLYGTEKATRKPIAIDSWVQEVHYLVKENGGWTFHGNAGGTSPLAPPASAPHHPLF